MAHKKSTKKQKNQSYTYSSGGQTYVATSTANTTQAQKDAVESNSNYKKVSRNDSQNVDIENAINENMGKANSVTPASTSISAADIGKVAPMNIPPDAAPINYTGTMTGANASLGAKGTEGALIEPQKTEAATPVVSTKLNLFDRVAKDVASLYQSPTNTEGIYNKLQKDAGIQSKQQAVASYSNQINAITTKAQADKLSLEGQGRGIPEVIIGGQQAQISKEAAIQALPLQAQLAAAQNDLELAQTHVDTLFKIRVADATAKADRYNQIVDKVYDQFTKEEQRQLDENKSELSYNRSTVVDRVNYAQSLATEALKNGNLAAFRSLTSLKAPDASSKNFVQEMSQFNSEVARFGGSIVDQSSALDLQMKRAQLANVYSQIDDRKSDSRRKDAESSGSGLSTKPLSGEAAKTYSIASTLIPEVQQLKSRFTADYKGTVRKILTKTDPELNRLVDNAADKVGRLRSGGAVNKEEEARFKGQIARYTDVFFGTPDATLNALDGLIAEASTVIGGLESGLSGAASATSPLKKGAAGQTTSGLKYSIE